MMFRRILSFSLVLLTVCANGQESLDAMIERGLQRSRTQAEILAKALENNPGRLPRTVERGSLQTVDYRGWVSGFFPGVLWQLYDNFGDQWLRDYAELYTDRVEPAKLMRNTHDLGFMVFCSFGQGYRITGNEHYLDVILEATDNLMTRFSEKTATILSWDPGKPWGNGSNKTYWKYPVIIDNMMNLEMICFTSNVRNDRDYLKKAMTHANTTIRNHFRPDYSTFHVVSYDPETGIPHSKNTAQGYRDESAWARGQSWGLYGYTMMYRITREKAYLDQAKHIADFLTSHPNMPADKIPYWDYDDPQRQARDASSAAIMASALIELSQLDPGPKAAFWLSYAEDQLRSLSSDQYLAAPGELEGFILKHSTGNLPAGSEVDVPLSYADYYYIEALLRLKALRANPSGADDRAKWVDAMVKVADPVISNLAAGTLKKNMPFESLSDEPLRKEVSYLEAFGRTLCGIAPWLELGADNTPEGRLRAKYIDLTVKALTNAVDPKSPDHLMFDNRHTQPLVDAAFLAEGLLRAPSLWDRLSASARKNLVHELKVSRGIKPYESNWLLFASCVEAALLEFTGEYDADRLMYGVNKFRNDWYKGDAWYGDGPAFHFDYYNSLVIHPMFTEVLAVLKKHNLDGGDFLELQKERHGRLAQQLERLISPEGTYPAVGRSITYRFGHFHAMSSAALGHFLPEELSPAQVRCGLTAVIERQLVPEAFDRNGWLRVGFTGAQINMSESYINTGSEYLICAAFLPLGLPESDPFWAAPYTEWTNRKAWSGVRLDADHALGR